MVEVADPRDLPDDPGARWRVRRGGWILRLYEHSPGLDCVVSELSKPDQLIHVESIDRQFLELVSRLPRTSEPLAQ